MEYLLTMTTQVPEGTSEAAVQDIRTREAARSRELAAQGHLLRLWRAHDTAGMQAILAALPLYAWMSVQTTPLTPHPSDPTLTSS